MQPLSNQLNGNERLEFLHAYHTACNAGESEEKQFLATQREMLEGEKQKIDEKLEMITHWENHPISGMMAIRRANHLLENDGRATNPFQAIANPQATVPEIQQIGNGEAISNSIGAQEPSGGMAMLSQSMPPSSVDSSVDSSGAIATGTNESDRNAVIPPPADQASDASLDSAGNDLAFITADNDLALFVDDELSEEEIRRLDESDRRALVRSGRKRTYAALNDIRDTRDSKGGCKPS